MILMALTSEDPFSQASFRARDSSWLSQVIGCEAHSSFSLPRGRSTLRLAVCANSRGWNGEEWKTVTLRQERLFALAGLPGPRAKIQSILVIDLKQFSHSLPPAWGGPEEGYGPRWKEGPELFFVPF